MKKIIKIFTISVISLISFVSCSTSDTNNETIVTPADNWNSIRTGNYQVHEFKYNGHNYLVFNVGHNRAGVVHDPDCSCKNNE